MNENVLKVVTFSSDRRTFAITIHRLRAEISRNHKSFVTLEKIIRIAPTAKKNETKLN